MRGVILGINPRARLVDLTHQISPQNIAQASFVLGNSYRYFPPEAIHVVVVDPGVGTGRRPVLVSTPHGRFVGPDNGVLSQVLSGLMDDAPGAPGTASLPAEVTAVHLTNPAFWRLPVSHTFHGRDIFAPVAAHLSLGVLPNEMGESIDSLAWLPMPKPTVVASGIEGEIVYEDWYGNLVSNIPQDLLAGPSFTRVHIKQRRVDGLCRTFGDAPPGQELIALIDSNGFLEVAVPNGSAAALLGVKAGERIVVENGP
jgi:S-adenosylmethionine hydrolase